jgi:hypothetical protein
VSSLEKEGVIPGGIIRYCNKRSAIPRHNEIRDILARKICKDLGIPPMK